MKLCRFTTGNSEVRIGCRRKSCRRERPSYLFRSQVFPNGVVLLTGKCIVPADAFTLAAGDSIRIAISGIGVLENSVRIV